MNSLYIIYGEVESTRRELGLGMFQDAILSLPEALGKVGNTFRVVHGV